jgi:ketosteroid isomerase-like protein
MKKLLMIIPLVILLCFTFGCQQGEEVAEEPVVDVEADVEAIKDLGEERLAAVNTGDIDRLMSLYADNAVRIPPNEPALIGKEAIQGNFQQGFDLFTEETDSVVVDRKIGGDLVFLRGTWTSIQTPKTGGETLKYNGNWVAIDQKQPEGIWKIICEIWSDESLVYPPPKKE